jgi:hypothetical protein
VFDISRVIPHNTAVWIEVFIIYLLRCLTFCYLGVLCAIFSTMPQASGSFSLTYNTSSSRSEALAMGSIINLQMLVSKLRSLDDI